MDYYEQLRRKLNLYPLGFPKTEEIYAVLKTLFNEKEAMIASYLPNFPITHSANKISKKSKINVDECADCLKEMAMKGLIYENVDKRNNRRYSLYAAMPGFWEIQFVKAEKKDEKLKIVAELTDKALKNEYGKELHGYKTPSMRVVPVMESIDVSAIIYTYEEAKYLIENSGTIALTDCACRKAARRCNAPLDVCLSFGFIAENLIEKGFSKKITVKQAVDVLERSEEAGLVHCSLNCKPPVYIMCNCCSCCCIFMQGLTKFERPSSIAKSNFFAFHIKENCNLCKACIEICPVKAIFIEEEKIKIDVQKCIGCGLCVRKCRNNAIKLKRRKEQMIPPYNAYFLTYRMWKERGKLGNVAKGYLKDLI